MIKCNIKSIRLNPLKSISEENSKWRSGKPEVQLSGQVLQNSCSENFLKTRKRTPVSRNSHRRCPMKKAVLTMLAIFTQKRLQHSCFPVNIVKLLIFFFSIWVFFHDHSQITGQQGKGEGISLTPRYHFHSLHRHLDISRAITAESSPLHIGSTRTRPGNLWLPSASR